MPAEIRRFLRHMTRILVLAAVILGSIFWGIPPDFDNYFAGSLRQVELLRQIPGARIILAGGSNAAMGLDAELMQAELGIPVINTGLHAGLGIIPLRELQPYIHAGDVVIISLEYTMFSSPSAMQGEPAFLADWIEISPGRVRYLSEPLPEIPSIYVVMLQRKVNRTLEYTLNGGSLAAARTIFNSHNFDANGDFIGHLQDSSQATKNIPPDPYPVLNPRADMFVFLTAYERAIRARGATLYFEAPASRKSNCEATGMNNLAGFFENFRAGASIPVLTPLDQVCLPDRYFYDTAYHLNAEGRELRTRRLIDNLTRTLAQGK